MTLPGGTKLDLVWLDPGTFMMGASPRDPNVWEWERPQHRVTISQGFLMGKHEVSRGQWRSIMGGRGLPDLPEGLTDDDRLPVMGVSWETASVFLRELSEVTGLRFRLPTEAEWEYSCRAGTTGRAFVSWEELDDYMWHSGNSEGGPQKVGTKLPNRLGLHDMLGNASEWVSDYWGPYRDEPVWDPENNTPERFPLRVSRGGSYAGASVFARCSARGYGRPHPHIGLRVSLRLQAR